MKRHPLLIILAIIIVLSVISSGIKYVEDQLSGRAAWEECMSKASKEWNMKYADAAWKKKGALSRLDRADFYEQMCGKKP
jgi:hypothetical protein